MSDSTGSPRRLDLSFLVGLLVAFALIFLAGRWWLEQRAPEPPTLAESIGDRPTLEVGSRAGMSVLLDLEDDYVPLFETPHNYTLLVFFSTTCPGCRDEKPTWQELTEVADVWNVAPFLVATDPQSAPIQQYVADQGLEDFQVVYDPSGNLSSAFKIHFVPQYLLFDEDGYLVHRSFGFTEAHGVTPKDRARQILEGVFKTL